jgi:hypothetical protein
MRTISSCIRLFKALVIIIPCIVLIANVLKPVLREAALNSIADSTYKTAKEAVEAAGVLNDSPESLAAEINSYLEERFSKPVGIEIGAPAGNIAGFGLFYGRGPVLKSHIAVISKAEVCCIYNELNDELNDKGNYIQISIKVRYCGLLINGSTTYNYLARYFNGSTGELLKSTSK